MKQRERREQSYEALLGAAQKLFVSQGFRQTTVDQIANSTKLTKGAVYFHFKSKTEILLKLLERTERVVVDEMIKVIQGSGPAAKDRLVAVIHNQALLGETKRYEMLLLILTSLESKNRSASVVKKVNAIYDRMYGEIEKIIASGQRNGEFRQDVPAHEATAIFMASHDGTFLEWHRRKSKLNGQQLVRALREIILNGLLVKARHGRG
jgi:TetR/AcrR family transcriptional repressor of nem operon